MDAHGGTWTVELEAGGINMATIEDPEVPEPHPDSCHISGFFPQSPSGFQNAIQPGSKWDLDGVTCANAAAKELPKFSLVSGKAEAAGSFLRIPPSPCQSQPHQQNSSFQPVRVSAAHPLFTAQPAASPQNSREVQSRLSSSLPSAEPWHPSDGFSGASPKTRAGGSNALSSLERDAPHCGDSRDETFKLFSPALSSGNRLLTPQVFLLDEPEMPEGLPASSLQSQVGKNFEGSAAVDTPQCAPSQIDGNNETDKAATDWWFQEEFCSESQAAPAGVCREDPLWSRPDAEVDPWSTQPAVAPGLANGSEWPPTFSGSACNEAIFPVAEKEASQSGGPEASWPARPPTADWAAEPKVFEGLPGVQTPQPQFQWEPQKPHVPAGVYAPSSVSLNCEDFQGKKFLNVPNVRQAASKRDLKEDCSSLPCSVSSSISYGPCSTADISCASPASPRQAAASIGLTSPQLAPQSRNNPANTSNRSSQLSVESLLQLPPLMAEEPQPGLAGQQSQQILSSCCGAKGTNDNHSSSSSSSSRSSSSSSSNSGSDSVANTRLSPFVSKAELCSKKQLPWRRSANTQSSSSSSTSSSSMSRSCHISVNLDEAGVDSGFLGIERQTSRPRLQRVSSRRHRQQNSREGAATYGSQPAGSLLHQRMERYTDSGVYVHRGSSGRLQGTLEVDEDRLRKQKLADPMRQRLLRQYTALLRTLDAAKTAAVRCEEEAAKLHPLLVKVVLAGSKLKALQASGAWREYVGSIVTDVDRDLARFMANFGEETVNIKQEEDSSPSKESGICMRFWKRRTLAGAFLALVVLYLFVIGGVFVWLQQTAMGSNSPNSANRGS